MNAPDSGFRSTHTVPAHFVAPTSIPDYLDRLRRALAGAAPALVQDALYDAEEYLRSELAEHPGKSEAIRRILCARPFPGASVKNHEKAQWIAPPGISLVTQAACLAMKSRSCG